MPLKMKVAPDVVDGTIPVAEFVYWYILFCPEELVPSLLASDQFVALEFISVDEAALTDPEAPLKPVGAWVPVGVVDQIILTHRIWAAASTLEPVNV